MLERERGVRERFENPKSFFIFWKNEVCVVDWVVDAQHKETTFPMAKAVDVNTIHETD